MQHERFQGAEYYFALGQENSLHLSIFSDSQICQIPGYTVEEKMHIARRHLILKQLKEHGLTEDQLQLPDDTVRLVSK